MAETTRSQLNVPTKRVLLFVGALVAVLATLVIFRAIFWPLLLGLAIAYLLDPLVTRLEQRRVPRALGVVVTGLLFLGTLTLALVVVLPAVADQLHRLAERLPAYWQGLVRMARPWLGRLEDELPASAQDLPQAVIAALQTHIPQLASSAGKIVGALFGNLLDLLLLLLSLAFVVVFTFYLLRDFPRLKAAAFDLVPVPYREVTRERLAEVDDVIAGFVRGQLTIAAINASIYGVGLTVLGVPMSLVVAIAAGVGNLIPYMSVVFGLVPALLLTWLDQQRLTHLVGVLGLFAGAQMLEDMVWRPRILGKSVKLHPVWILLAIIAGGELFGVFGMILAVPVAGTIQVFARHWVAAYRASSVYWGSGVESSGLIVPDQPPGDLPLSGAPGARDRDDDARGS